LNKNSINQKQPFDRNTRSGPSCSGIALFLLILGLSPIILYLFLTTIGAILIVADPIVPVDAVVILSGDTGERLEMAAEMLNRGHVNNLVITNTDRTANRRLAQEAEKLGFDEDRIFITDLEVDSTLDEARAVLKFARQQGWSSFMVVTDPFHSFRTRVIFRRELRGSGVSISVRPVVGHWFRSSTWFFSRAGWNAVILEITKLFKYLLFHY
jgi:uncharacterized SAM-binding protein YcdF (DUF218 family)